MCVCVEKRSLQNDTECVCVFVYMHWIRETSCVCVHVCVCMCAGLEKHHMCVCREMMFKK